MIERLLKSHLEPVARRDRQLRLWRSLAVCWAATALAALVSLWCVVRLDLPKPLALSAVALVLVAGIALAIRHVRSRRADYRQIARRIEREHPDLHSLLITAVEQKPDANTGELSYLQARVIREAILEVENRKIITRQPHGSLKLAHAAHLCTLAIAVLVVGKLASVSQSEVRSHMPSVTSVTVEPGDISLERGAGLLVMARFTGPLPASVTCVITEDGEEPRRLPLERTLRDPVFGGSVPEVNASLKYHIEYAGARTRDYTVQIFEYPRLERADVEIRYPEYTGLAEKRVNDTRRVTAVEGSRIGLHLQLNKPVRSARLVAKDKTSLVLTTDTRRAVATLPDFVLNSSQSFGLELIDADGRTNKVPAQFVLDALKNKAPDLKLAAPRGDQRVSPLEEMVFAAEAADDFGLRGVGLTYSIAGQEEPSTIQFDAATGRHEKKQFAHLLKLEELRARPDQLVSWFVWADDIGPDGSPRRTSSDMYFAEVRPFDEIFRQGQGADGSSGQSAGAQMGGQTLKLAELQKQIINATWKLQRQFPTNNAGNVSANYRKDAAVVRDSQEAALEQAGELSAQVDDPRFKTLWETVESKMQRALDQLNEATNSSAVLPKALNAEQAAYQALLALSAREYQVTRNQRGGGGGEAGGGRSQQQLENLDLKEDKDRYETQRQAAGAQPKPEQREQLAVLSRLKELAQRQQDLNERLKDLQTALREAQTEAERKELERELKRLRDEQRELLADIDEVGQRMERNQSQMAESREQLEQTRSHVQSAAEALEKESVEQALSAGTRAQRELQQLRDDFRKKNSNQFAEDMREMRQAARELAHTQQEISNTMDAEAKQKQKTLTASEDAKAIASKFQEQKTGLTNLLQNMRQVSEQAEVSEPMLSRQLYETVRKTSQGNLENNLSLSEELLKRSFLPEAAQLSQRAQEEFNELKQGVEQAASGVLGDEAEALRFAKSELDDLARQIEKELTQATGQSGQKAEPGDPQAQQSARASRNGTNSVQRAGQGEQSGQSESNPASAQAQNSQQRGTGQSEQSQSEQGQNGQSQTAQNQNGRGQRQPGQSENGQSQQGQSQSGQNGQGQNAPSQTAQNGQNNSGEQGGRRADNRGGDGGRFDPRRWTGSEPGGADGGNGHGGPLTGEEFREWSDRLGQVEELMDQPDLRSEAGRIRDRARSLRAEFKRHSKEPQWDLVRAQVFSPLTELRNRVAEELARLQSTESLVPIDRDPVPNRYSDLVRRYYEKLGQANEKP